MAGLVRWEDISFPITVAEPKVGRQVLKPKYKLFEWSCFLLVALLLAGSAYADEPGGNSRSVFVPYKSYVHAKRDDYRRDLILNSGCSEQAIETMLNHAEQTGFMFSAENVVSTFPTIFNSDHLNISCMRSPVRMEFLSVMSTNTVMVKKVMCDLLLNGMQCSPPIESERYFLMEPGKTIELSDNVSFDEAVAIIEWFRHDAGMHFSEDEKNRIRQLSWRTSIGKVNNQYALRIGDPYCDCALKLSLGAAGTGTLRERITVHRKPQFDCPN